ncbi:hypothetical protein K501DRAFT_328561 [Backusella circina FSU 941]|nr:hypothetical protein K501DRAFT_328561 [Backusella circina FSU 941]
MLPRSRLLALSIPVSHQMLFGQITPKQYITRITKSRNYYIVNDISQFGETVLPAIHTAWEIKDVIKNVYNIMAANRNQDGPQNSEWSTVKSSMYSFQRYIIITKQTFCVTVGKGYQISSDIPSCRIYIRLFVCERKWNELKGGRNKDLHHNRTCSVLLELTAVGVLVFFSVNPI